MSALDDSTYSHHRMITPLDSKRVRRQFGNAGNRDFLSQEVGQRLLERLQALDKKFSCAVDLGAGAADDLQGLSTAGFDELLVAADFACSLLSRSTGNSLCADAYHLPLAAGSVDLAYSNLLLPWIEDLDRLFAELRRVMRPAGVLMFTSLGPDTLMELRASWAQADDAIHVHEFLDMHHIGDALVNAGFMDPVLDVERLTVTYDDPRDLMRDLRASGNQNAALDRPRGLRGKRSYQSALNAYKALRVDGNIPATFEVIYGYALAPREGQPRRTDAGQEASFSVESLRNTLRSTDR